jgi:hypothetical protein
MRHFFISCYQDQDELLEKWVNVYEVRSGLGLVNEMLSWVQLSYVLINFFLYLTFLSSVKFDELNFDEMNFPSFTKDEVISLKISLPKFEANPKY